MQLTESALQLEINAEVRERKQVEAVVSTELVAECESIGEAIAEQAKQREFMEETLQKQKEAGLTQCSIAIGALSEAS